MLLASTTYCLLVPSSHRLASHPRALCFPTVPSIISKETTDRRAEQRKTQKRLCSHGSCLQLEINSHLPPDLKRVRDSIVHLDPFLPPRPASFTFMATLRLEGILRRRLILSKNSAANQFIRLQGRESVRHAEKCFQKSNVTIAR